MTEQDDPDEVSSVMDMGEHLRTWRLFVSVFKWNVVALAALMLLLLIFRT